MRHRRRHDLRQPDAVQRPGRFRRLPAERRSGHEDRDRRRRRLPVRAGGGRDLWARRRDARRRPGRGPRARRRLQAGALRRGRDRLPEAVPDCRTTAGVLRPEGRAAGRGRVADGAGSESGPADSRRADGSRRRRPGALLPQRAAVAGRAPVARWRSRARSTPGWRRRAAAAIRSRQRGRCSPDSTSITSTWQRSAAIPPWRSPRASGGLASSTTSGSTIQSRPAPARAAGSRHRWPANPAPSASRRFTSAGPRSGGDLIAMVTAYDAPSARLAEKAAIDGILVGDSAAMTVLGHDSTVQITVDEMLMLTRAVARSVYKPLVVADMPFGSFQVSDEEAVQARGAAGQGGRRRRRQARRRGPDADPRQGDRRRRHPGDGTRRADAAVGGRARRLPRPGAARSRREAPARRSAGAAERRLLRRRPGSDSRRSSPSASRGRSRFQPSGSAPARTATARFSSGTTCWA